MGDEKEGDEKIAEIEASLTYDQKKRRRLLELLYKRAIRPPKEEKEEERPKRTG